MDLVKVYVDLPGHWATGGESMWALPLGDDLFELRNVPFYAYDLNFLDVVRAISKAPDLKPEVQAVVRRSGHRTLRIFFGDRVDSSERNTILAELRRYHVSYEGSTERFFALDLAPEAEVARVRAHLDELHSRELLAYETCEARVEGRFDDKGDDVEGR